MQPHYVSEGYKLIRVMNGRDTHSEPAQYVLPAEDLEEDDVCTGPYMSNSPTDDKED